MGQATLDLPDPTQLSGANTGPLSPEALASADDLLSQLAGDDIDRLLAEAEAERPAAAPPQTPPQPVPSPQVVETSPTVVAVVDTASSTDAAIDAILAPVIESTLKAVDEEIAAALPAVDIVPADAVPGAQAAVPPIIEPEALTATGEAAVTPAEAPAVRVEQPPHFIEQKLLDDAAAHVSALMDPPAPVPVPTASAAVADAAERQALSEPLVIPPAPANPSLLLRFLVKVLELINSPMLLFSDQVRELMGKIAIVTTFNATAVIVYVLVFRRPHH